ncbi:MULTISPECIES: glycoside hydrolase family 43 protein [unclassified Micromonospora]|uniref:glycoside hydrolase family 43 protein n=1 Tax=unclassified Micromonospora TaxID=2617518 RepID=UPI001C220B89|nr:MULTISPECIES: glycoside hydrolase family 43 protein [unclassified Micromonospora]MBU8861804.1 glycoside hydrolase family 43 protein [Micromonospora sp. WMMB482]MDM4781385.1 glycoside hydrolase family 43 protein [Micromonospora sp. b486]
MTELLAPGRPGPAGEDTALIRNPVLPGFHPDPSILRVGDDYYLATSTFEWYPGVRVHHSRDLVHWRPLGGVLTDRRLLDLTGCPDSGGVWAPCLSHVDGEFHLVFTDVDSYTGGFWDTPNFVTTAPSIDGPWSDPAPLHARGFDPSLFHDDDGRSWLLSNACDWRPGRSWAGGIIAQEYDRRRRVLVGKSITLFDGTPAGFTEGPHLYRRGDWYYLVTAEGGTGWEHQVTVARSRSLTGPYVADPDGPMLTSTHRPDLPLQKAGHGSLVAAPNDQWYLAHLTARPLGRRGACVLGRETALQRVDWTVHGWPRVEGGIPHERVPGPRLPARPWREAPQTDDFDADRLDPAWSTLRRPPSPDWLSLTARPGHLRLAGGQSPSSRHRVSLVARRIEHPRATFSAVVDFIPRSYQHLAGVVAYYNTRNWYYAHLTCQDGVGVVADVLTCRRGRLRRLGRPVPVHGPVELHVALDGPALRFAQGAPGAAPTWWPDVFDATILSDEHATEIVDGVPEVWGFTGAFFGLWVQDLTGGDAYADFDRTTYRAAR